MSGKLRAAAKFEALVFLPRVTHPIRREQRRRHRLLGESLAHKIAHPLDHVRAFALMKNGVISRGKNMHLLHRTTRGR